jgi:uncharacterized protein YegL
VIEQFFLHTARPLPVFLLIDTSGSMDEPGKIDAVNQAVRIMVNTLADESGYQADLLLALITFGDKEAKVHQPLAPTGEVNFVPLTARGRTPMGGALRLLRGLIEDQTIVPSRAYRPTVLLVSDGIPTDDFEAALEEFNTSPRASKVLRYSMIIGDDPGDEGAGVLRNFMGSENAVVFHAQEARDIRKAFKFVTMSVTARTRSATPDHQAVSPADYDQFEEFLDDE